MKIYFNWFKKYNHLFKDFELDETAIDDYKAESMEVMGKRYDTLDTNKHNTGSSNESDQKQQEEGKTMQDDSISNQYSSVIKDKYQDDMDAPTVANKIADMIINLEA